MSTLRRRSVVNHSKWHGPAVVIGIFLICFLISFFKSLDKVLVVGDDDECTARQQAQRSGLGIRMHRVPLA